MKLFSRNKPKIKVTTVKKDSFSGWIKCSKCGDLIHKQELEQNLNCCPKCGYHYRLSVEKRIELLIDKESFTELFSDILPADPLEFFDTKKYTERLEEAQEKTQRKEAVTTGFGKIDGKDTAFAVMDFSFMGGSMGSVVGEKITRLIEFAVENKLPLVIVAASGGARMQESIFSLMQMAKTSAALTRLHEAHLPYISVLTNPTTGGVTASFASLGDIIIAEPEALIGFAGPRVVEQTINQKLPEGAQKSEFLLERGMIDVIVPRVQLKEKISFFIGMLSENGAFKKPLKKDLTEKLQKLLEKAEEQKISL
ncbi:MAG: acetyl-CoA carboxylase carboxyltransferase subunit beta [Parachlamydiales bacterium]|nr:acetyl-CoA carboxylase carboxyltransferase subunit beta [Parachlamydiales bacterium]